MRELRRAAHTVYSLHYHFVFTTKDRKPVRVGEVDHTVRDLIREIYRSEDVEILQGHVRDTCLCRTSRYPGVRTGHHKELFARKRGDPIVEAKENDD